MKNLSFLTVLVFIGFTFLQCAKTEDPNIDTIPNETSVKVSGNQFQVIEIPVVSFTLSQEEYSATLGDSMVTVFRHTDSTLVTTIPLLPAGEYTLTIYGLEGFLISVTVSETVLESTPEVIISGINTNLNAIAQSISDTSSNKADIDNAIAAFEAILANSTENEKRELALFYQANKKVFDDLLAPIDSDSRKNTMISLSDFTKLTYSVLTIGAGALVLKYAITPGEKAFGVAVATVGVVKSIEIINRIHTKELKVLDLFLKLIGFEENSKSNKKSGTNLSFVNESAKTINLSYDKRILIDADKNDSNNILSNYFNDLNSLNKSLEIIPMLQLVIMILMKPVLPISPFP